MRSASIAAAALLLSACSGVPETSAVRYGTDSTSVNSRQTRVIARPPVDGMSPQAVVRGFLDACADPSNNYLVAREYMTAPTAAGWDPNSGVRIYDNAGLTLTESDRGVTLEGRLQGTVSSDGLYSVVAAAPALQVPIGLATNEAGQWRITSVPNGLILSRSDVERGFRSLAIYFLSPGLDTLVAEPMLTPATSSAVATALVRRLLAGPSVQLKEAVTTAFPAGTTLTYGSVPVKGGVASVDLSSDVLAADPAARRGLAAQLVWTLSQLPEVAEVRLSVSGQQLAVPGIGVVSDTKDWPSFNPAKTASRLYVAKGPVIQLVTDGAGQPVSRMTPPAAKDLGAIAVNPRNSMLAAVTSNGREIVANLDVKSRLRTVLTGDLLTRPTWDIGGNVYSADYGRGVVAVAPDGSELNVTLDANDIGIQTQIKQLAFAADGVRVAVVLGIGARDILAVGVVSAASGTARISGLHRVEGGVDSVRDLAWSGPLSLVLLGAAGSGGQRVITVGIADGKVSAAQTPVGTQTLAVTSGGSPFVGVIDGTATSVMAVRSGQWAVVAQGAGPAFGP